MLRLDWNLLFTVINLLILYVLMKRFLFKPVNEILEKRQREEDARLSAAEEAKNSALKSKEEYEASIKNAEQEKAQIVTKAREEAAGIQKRGVKGWCKNFAEPIAIVAPINVLEIFIRPLSLCMRLFGNVLGAFVIMELIKQLVPVVLPLPFSFYFDIFDGLIQAYVFVFLTSLFIKEA